MKKLVSLVCVLSMFAILIPAAGAMSVAEINSTVKLNQTKSVKIFGNTIPGNMISLGKRDKAHGKSYLHEPVIQDNMISLGKRDKAHGKSYLHEPVIQDNMIS